MYRVWVMSVRQQEGECVPCMEGISFSHVAQWVRSSDFLNCHVKSRFYVKPPDF